MIFQQGEKWSYDPHQVISNGIVHNSYAAYARALRPELKKLANGGLV